MFMNTTTITAMKLTPTKTMPAIMVIAAMADCSEKGNTNNMGKTAVRVITSRNVISIRAITSICAMQKMRRD